MNLSDELKKALKDPQWGGEYHIDDMTKKEVNDIYEDISLNIATKVLSYILVGELDMGAFSKDLAKYFSLTQNLMTKSGYRDANGKRIDEETKKTWENN